jgi:hypothetical protein
MDIDTHATLFPGEQIQRRHVDAPDEQYVHHHSSEHSDTPQPSSRGRHKRTDRHDDVNGKPGRLRHFECTDWHDNIERNPGGIGELERTDGHDNIRGKPGGIGKLELTDGHDNIRGEPGRFRRLVCSNDHWNLLLDLGGWFYGGSVRLD